MNTVQVQLIRQNKDEAQQWAYVFFIVRVLAL